MDGPRRDRQDTGIDRRPIPIEPRRRRLKTLKPGPKTTWEHLLELEQCPGRRLVDPGDGVAGGCPQPDDDRNGLVVVEQEGWHDRARAEAVATSAPRVPSTG